MRRYHLPFLFLLTSLLPSQEATPRAAMGFAFSSLAGDFGMSLEATSPYVWKERAAARISIGTAYRQGIPLSNPTETHSETYTYATLGLVGVGGTLPGGLRLYGEGGLLVAFPRAAFSDHSSHAGGYGRFGFEFLMGPRRHQGASCFFELGAVGLEAHAEKQVGSPIYLNGFTISTGLRIYL